MRLFTAIDISDDLRNNVTQLQQQFPDGLDVKWVEKENLHITLCFIGNLGKGNVGDLKYNLSCAGKSVRPFNLEVGSSSLIRGRVFILSITGDLVDFAQLQKSISFVCPRKSKLHPPHITLGRFRCGGYSEVGNAEFSFNKDLPSIYVDKFSLYSSRLTPKGPIYDRLDNFSLGS